MKLEAVMLGPEIFSTRIWEAYSGSVCPLDSRGDTVTADPFLDG